MRVGKYDLVELLGRGGIGEVWKARDAELSRWIALKFVSSGDPDEAKRFMREAQTAASLSHPNIGAIYEVGREDDRSFIAMQLVSGGTLDALKADAKTAARHVRDAALAVAHANDKGIIHRDIKPANVMVDDSGRVYVMDFGLARRQAAKSSLTASGMVVGTPAYMSPEQARGETGAVDARSDVYGLGATLYAVLSGRAPFEGSHVVEVILRVVADDPAPLPAAVPRDLRAIVSKCLEKEPARRYQSAAALAEDLGRFLDGAPVHAHPPTPMYLLRRRLSRHRALVLTLSTAVAVMAVALALLLPPLLRRDADLAWRDKLRPLEDAIREARPHLYIEGADVASKMKQVEQVAAELERLAADPSYGRHADLWTTVGLGWEFVGDDVRAERALTEAQRLSPGPSAASFHLARIYFDRWRFQLDLAVHRSEGDRQHRADEWRRRATDQIRLIGAGWAGAGEMDLELAKAYLAFLQSDQDGLHRICREALQHLRDSVGSEEFWMLLAVGTETKAALQAYGRAIDRRPHFPIAYFLRAIARADTGDMEGAMKDCLETIRQSPAFAPPRCFRATLRHRAGDKAGAYAECDELLGTLPSSVAGYLCRASLFFLDGRPDRAAGDYDAALRLDPNSVMALGGRGGARLVMGDLAGAAEDVGRAIELDPENVIGRINRGEVRLIRTDLDGAAHDFEWVLARFPGDALAMTGRGRVQSRRGDWSAALLTFDAVVRIDARSAEGHALRGTARLETGDAPGALADLDEAIRLDPRMDHAYANRGRAHLALGRVDAALADLDEAVRIDPEPDSLYNRGLVRDARGEYDRAIADYTEALRLKPDLAKAYTNRGSSRQRNGDLEGARADYDEAIRRDAGSAVPWFNRATLRRAQGDADGAVADYGEAIARDPKCADAFFGRALAWLAKGDSDRALEDYTATIGADPRHARGRVNRGNLLAARGELKEALADFDEAIRADGALPEARVGRAFVRARLKDIAGAIADYERALAVAPPGWPARGDVERRLEALKRGP